MNEEMEITNWTMILSTAKAIIEKAETKEDAIQELDKHIEKAKTIED